MIGTVQRGFGLRFDSELPIPGAVAIAHAPDIEAIPIALAEPRALSGEGDFRLQGEDIVYAHATGVFRCGAQGIAIEPGDPIDVEDLGALFVANALPALLWQRGAFMLHAAGLRLPSGHAIAIAGPRGSGKSWLAADLLAAGAMLVGDDSLALHSDHAGVTAAGLSGGWFERVPDVEGRTFRHAAPGQQWPDPVALDLLVFLDGPGREPAPVSQMATVELLLRHRHRALIPQLLGREALALGQATRIASRVPAVMVSPDLVFEQGSVPIQGAIARLADYPSRVTRPGI